MATDGAGRNDSSREVRWYHRWLLGAASAIAIVCLSLIYALAAPLTSHAGESSIPFSFNFTDLRPGVPATQTVDLVIPRDGDLNGFAWLERTGILETAQFGFEVCEAPGAECTPASTVKKPVAVTAGNLHLRVTVVISEQGSGTAIGQLTLASRDDVMLTARGGGLALTGTNPANIALWATAALALGTVALVWPRTIILAARRRRDGDNAGNIAGHITGHIRNDSTHDEEGTL